MILLSYKFVLVSSLSICIKEYLIRLLVKSVGINVSVKKMI